MDRKGFHTFFGRKTEKIHNTRFVDLNIRIWSKY